MSSHQEWVDEIVAAHDADQPFAPENGERLRFKPGDQVIYTNEYGVEFPNTIIAFYERSGAKDTLYALGARYWTSGFSPCPVRESELRADANA